MSDSQNTPDSSGTTPPSYPAAPSYPAPPAYGQNGGQGGYAQQPYGGQGQPGAYPAAYPYAPTAKTNVLAVISLIGGIAGILFILPFIGSLAGIICGHISLNQIKANGEGGRGLALTGLILGYVALALLVLLLILIFAVFIPLAATSGTRFS